MENGSKTGVLIVDDQAHIRLGMSRILLMTGFEVVEASRGEGCIKPARAFKPDLFQD